MFRPAQPPLLSCWAAVTQPLGNQDVHAAGAMLSAPLPPPSHVPRERTVILGRQRKDGVKGQSFRNSSWQETGTSLSFCSGHSRLVMHCHHFTRTGTSQFLSPCPTGKTPSSIPSILCPCSKPPPTHSPALELEVSAEKNQPSAARHSTHCAACPAVPNTKNPHAQRHSTEKFPLHPSILPCPGKAAHPELVFLCRKGKKEQDIASSRLLGA